MRRSHPESLFAAFLLASLVLLASSCDSFSNIGDGNSRDGLEAHLAPGFHPERANVDPGEDFTLRFTLKNAASAPAFLTGIGFVKTDGAIRFLDGMAQTRTRGDREPAFGRGWPPDEEDFDIETLDDVTDTAVPARHAVDLFVGFDYESGLKAGFSGVVVYYRLNDTARTAKVDVGATLCRGLAEDREGCIEGDVGAPAGRG